MSKETLPALKVSTGWIELEIISEPDVILTTFGYAPILSVKEITTESKYRLYISAKSLAVPLEELRKANAHIFEGIQFRVRKESTDQRAPYEVDTEISVQNRGECHINPDNDFQERSKLSEDLRKKLQEALLNN